MAGITFATEGNISQIQPYSQVSLTVGREAKLGIHLRKAQLVDWYFAGETDTRSNCEHGQPFYVVPQVALYFFGVTPGHVWIT